MKSLLFLLTTVLCFGFISCASVDSYLKTNDYDKAAELIQKMPENTRAAEHAKLADALLADFIQKEGPAKIVEVRDVERLAYHYKKADGASMKRGLTAIAELLAGRDKGEKTDQAIFDLYIAAGLSREQASLAMAEKYAATAEAMMKRNDVSGARRRYEQAMPYFQASARPDRNKAISRQQMDAEAKRIEADTKSPDNKSAWGKNAAFEKELARVQSNLGKYGVSKSGQNAFRLDAYLSAMTLMPTAYEYLLKSAIEAANGSGSKSVLADLFAAYEKIEKPIAELWYKAVDAALLNGMKDKAIAFIDRIEPNALSSSFSDYDGIQKRYETAGVPTKEAARRAGKKALDSGKVSQARTSIVQSLDPSLLKALAEYYGSGSRGVFDKDEEELLKAASGSQETLVAVAAPLAALDPKKVEAAVKQAGVPMSMYAKAFADAMLDKEPTLARAYYLKAGDKPNAFKALDKMLAQGKALVERSKGFMEGDETHKAKVSGGAVLVRGAAKEYWTDGDKKTAKAVWDYLMSRDPSAFNLEAYGLLVDFDEPLAKAARTVMDAAKKTMWTTPAYKVVAGDASVKSELLESFKKSSFENEKRMHAILLHRLGASGEASKLLSDSRLELMKFTGASEAELPDTDAGKLAAVLFDMGEVVGRQRGGEKTLAQLYLTVAMDNILISYSERTARDVMAIYAGLTETSVRRLLKLPPTATDADIDARLKYGNPDYKVSWVMSAAGTVLPTAQKEFARIGY